LYSTVRENAPAMFKIITGARFSSFISFFSYESFLGRKITKIKQFCIKNGIDLQECLDDPKSLSTPKKIFERKIRYWETRPMPPDPDVIVSPADARVVIGSLNQNDHLYIKNKFFSYEQLLGKDKRYWLDAFKKGDYAIFRLTPDKYHYNHMPVSGRVVDFYEIDGIYHSCNPSVLIALATPLSMNKRVVTIIDTDVAGGTKTGLVAMIEVAALMIGDILQCYSEERYENPQQISIGMFLKKGSPKSLYRPGSSTDILLFQKDRVQFADDILEHLQKRNIMSRFTFGLEKPLVEVDLKVRSYIGKAIRPT